MTAPDVHGSDLIALLIAEFSPQVERRLPATDAAAFTDRLAQILPDAVRCLGQLYGAVSDLPDLLRSLVGDVLERAALRGEPERVLDRARGQQPDWFCDQSMVGYVCYTDRFAGSLTGVRGHLDHLGELGVRYLHLMPVLQPRAGDSDGGYAVLDYDAVDPRIGTMDDLTGLAADLHSRDMSLCIDMVLNHTAREHEWARRAAAGEEHYRDFYLTFPDRTLPDAYERTLPDIFPELAPGSFTWDDELRAWMWTTFYDFQWDLNYANPAVFRAMLDTMLRLANRGVDVLRVDAAPFLWKRLGTDCMNQPEAHLVLQGLRALTRLGAPGLLLKAEAMVGPDLLGGYLGAHEVNRPECDLAYDNQLMVMLWSSVATGDARLATAALSRRAPAPPGTSWVTYVRCHDDIGWAVSDIDAAAVGLDGPAYRRQLSQFYAGQLPGSFARGRVFQDSPQSDSPISGTLASLCGIEAALADGDGNALELALRRLESMYSAVFSFGGIPLIYMGDELALLNDYTALADTGQRIDNRWLHRPQMDWAAAASRHDPDTVAGRAHRALRTLAQVRAGQVSLAAGASNTLLDAGDQRLLAYRRGEPGHRPVLAAVNMSAEPVELSRDGVTAAGILQPVPVHSTSGAVRVDDGPIVVPACGFVWIGDGTGR